MKEPLISVLIPAYNHERYVEDAVRSVLAQDRSRIELIVVDDGSTDGTWGVLQGLRAECASRLERVKMEQQENRGTAETVQRLLSLARGDYVGILASDDQYLPGALMALSAVLLRNPDVGVVVGENELMDENGRRCYWDGDRRTVYDSAQAVYRTLNELRESFHDISRRHPGYGTYRELLGSNHIANGYLIRRSCLDRTVLPSHSTPLEDWWMMLQLSKISRIVSVDVPTFRYRWHAGNTIRQSKLIDAYAIADLQEEERLLVRTCDRRHFKMFAEQYGECRARYGLPPAFHYVRYRTWHASVVVVSVFGLSFVFSRRLVK